MGLRTGWTKAQHRQQHGREAGGRNGPSTATVAIHARVRLHHATEALTGRLRPGDIAVIDRVDLDRDTAQYLVDHSVAAVLNVASSMTGRYPNLGPQVVMDAGIPLVDEVDPSVFGRVVDGERLRLEEGTLYRGSVPLAGGTPRDAAWLAAATSEARAGMCVQLEALAAGARECLRHDSALYLDGVGIPELTTPLSGRHVVVAVRGRHLRHDLDLLRAYRREYRPLLLAVDDAAESLLELGYRPDLVLADLTTLSERVVDCGAEIVAHAAADGPVPGRERLARPERDVPVLHSASSSVAAALLLADGSGAPVIVTAGMHRSLPELLDGGRSLVAGTFLAQLRVGGTLVDARAASRLHRSRVSVSALLTLVVAALLVVLVAGYSTPVGQVYLEAQDASWETFRTWLGEVIP
ncbi:putative cytokinetic ring protein SteA [Lipingzhangella sp. LS1_29]|uniref:Cytokinetic ring protein SteA n=1 Tax=Lipingzhangella rawalii TaxID=2055835 RepID=A0ABU2H2H4_9ACTN|nr:putative cytokinetic ring protein SteA [Lipingzhangella rawalii]MDS1269491.1 putative cytokinetic ring protein SteA [Lipingzhangella rawalii]